jgi:hypothetical protein
LAFVSFLMDFVSLLPLVTLLSFNCISLSFRCFLFNSFVFVSLPIVFV